LTDQAGSDAEEAFNPVEGRNIQKKKPHLKGMGERYTNSELSDNKRPDIYCELIRAVITTRNDDLFDSTSETRDCLQQPLVCLLLQYEFATQYSV
jgi:hypothetical protein